MAGWWQSLGVKEGADLTTAILFKILCIHIGQIAPGCLVALFFFFFASKFCYVFITIKASKVT